MFTFAYNDRSASFEIQDREFRAVKEKLLFQLTNMGQPYVTVVEANHENRGELYLKHRFDGVELRQDYAKATIENLFKVWNRPVHIQTVVGESVTILTFDGENHRERTTGDQSAA
jgi:stage V sporulation protein R